MYLLINFIIPIMFTALTTELTCLLARAKENGGARLVLTPEAFMPAYGELSDTEGEEPLFFPFTDRHHTLALQTMTLSGALPSFRPTISSNGEFGISSMVSSYLDYECDDIEDLEYCQEQHEEAIWYSHVENCLFDGEDEAECLSFMIDPVYDKYVAKTEGSAIMQCSAVFNLELLSSELTEIGSYTHERIGEIVTDFAKAMFLSKTFDVPDFEVLPCQGAKAIMEFHHMEHEPIAHPIGRCCDEYDVSLIAKTKKNIALADVLSLPDYIVTIDEDNIDTITGEIVNQMKKLK